MCMKICGLSLAPVKEIRFCARQIPTRTRREIGRRAFSAHRPSSAWPPRSTPTTSPPTAQQACDVAQPHSALHASAARIDQCQTHAVAADHSRMLVNSGLSRSHSLPYRFAEPRTVAADIMSTIELVDRELRDALALWPVEPLTADSLTQRRANLLKVIGAVPKRDLPDITADEIRVESTFGAKPIRVLTYRPVKSDNPCPPSYTFMAAASWRARPRRRMWRMGCSRRI